MWRTIEDAEDNPGDSGAGIVLLARDVGAGKGTALSEDNARHDDGWCVDCNVFSALCARQGHRVVLLNVCVSNGQIFDKVRSVVKIKGKEMKMKNSVRVYKTSKLYTSLYGRAAYEAWKAREEEIDALRVSGKCSKKEIAKMYEDNLRQLKTAGEKTAADGTLTESFEKIRAVA